MYKWPNTDFFFLYHVPNFPNSSTAKIFIGRSRDCIFRKKKHIFISFRLADTATVMNSEKILFFPCVFITQSPTYILPGNKSENLTKKLSTKIGLCPMRETNRSLFQSMENSLFCGQYKTISLVLRLFSRVFFNPCRI